MRERKIKEEELYQMYKAEMEQEDLDDDSSEFSLSSQRGGAKSGGFTSAAADTTKKQHRRSGIDSSLEH